MARTKTKSWPKWPRKMNEDNIGKLEIIFRIDWTVSEACNYANIDLSTYYEHLKTNKQFSQRMAQAQEYPFILARKWLFKNVQKEDMKAIDSFLKRRDWRYKDKQEIVWELKIVSETELLD